MSGYTHTPISAEHTIGRRTAIAFLVVETQSGKVGHWSKRVGRVWSSGSNRERVCASEPEVWRTSPANGLGRREGGRERAFNEREDGPKSHKEEGMGRGASF